MREKLNKIMMDRFHKSIQKGSNEEVYFALLEFVKTEVKQKKQNSGKRKVYYISAEFLIGKLLSNNLINLGLYQDAAKILEENGKSLGEIEELEPEPSLGNGGLGRLAACFLDSMATLGLPGDGIGLNYHFGLFKQVFQNHKQAETKNPWIQKEGWLTDTGISYEVPFGKFTLHSKLYDIDVIGYDNGYNKLHLFDVEGLDETLVQDGIKFDKKKIEKNLTLFLYPDDSDEAGNLLRIYQQYFMVCNGVQLILEECQAAGYDFDHLDKHIVIQINDTHPSMVIPELIRQLQKRGIDMEEATNIVQKTCAYTNHTILAEALEKWPVAYLEEVVPQLMPIIKFLDKKIRVQYKDSKLAIIDSKDRVHMAYMDIHYGFSVNGVAALHTEILKTSELSKFYALYPEKFNNKTNGITFRRWLMHCNQELDQMIQELIGIGYRKDAEELLKLLKYKEDETVLNRLLQIKYKNKLALKQHLEKTDNVILNENAIFDIQIKRLHEYKRQQMNALYVIYKYLEIKNGRKPSTPITILFGAKAAPAYTIAKDIIHFILCLSELIQKDKEVSPYLQVVMVENYNVTMAEKLIPACDLSEQISLASKEASGTGNMKFMLNGAVTLGTMDGANVEIAELVGPENIYIFGESSETVIQLYETSGYRAVDSYIKDAEIRKLVDFLISPEILSIGDPYLLLRLHAELIQKDWFMTLLDLKDYIKRKEQALCDYEDRINWAKKMLVNIAKSGFFSSDRTIKQYNKEIWKL